MPTRSRRSTFFAATTMALSAIAAQAHNGKVAFAYPASDIAIDGSFSDWPSQSTWNAIEHYGDDNQPAHGDLSAEFRVAYGPDASLFVAVRVTDDEHVEARKASSDWTAQDTHLLYVDQAHEKKGSGSVLYVHANRRIEIASAPGTWDPKNANASWSNTQVSQTRRGNVTQYEWRVSLDTSLAAGQTIGLDHLIFDSDPGDEEGSIALWGPEFSKSANTHRLGDVVLMEPHERTGTLSGKLVWPDGIDHPIPNRLRVTSTANSQRWFQALVDASGEYAISLPQGEYRLSVANALTVPFSEEAQNLPLRIRPVDSTTIVVDAAGRTIAPTVKLRTLSRPDYLFGTSGRFTEIGPAHFRALSTFIDAFRQYYEIPGASVAVVDKDKVIYHETFGLMNNVTGKPVRDDTLFEAASITKPVFALAVMRLVERGLIELDKPLQQYLPFDNLSEDERYKKITARWVLSHQTGLPNWAWGGPGGWEGGAKLALGFDPGSQFGYSGEAFNYLGRVIEHVTQKPLDELMHTEVSGPMGLRDTHYRYNAALAPKTALGHFHIHPHWKAREERVSPASSMLTSSLDFSNFMMGLLQGKGASKATYAEMFRAQRVIPADQRVYDDGEMQAIGLGVFVRETAFGRLIEHGGNNGDFDAKFGIIPDAGLGYAIFTNSNVGDELVRALEQYLLTGRPKSETAATAP